MQMFASGGQKKKSWLLTLGVSLFLSGLVFLLPPMASADYAASNSVSISGSGAADVYQAHNGGFYVAVSSSGNTLTFGDGGGLAVITFSGCSVSGSGAADVGQTHSGNFEVGVSSSGNTLNLGDGGGLAKLTFTSTSYSCPSGGTLSGTTCITNGACGSVINSASAYTAPTTNLCSGGTATAVSHSTGVWHWRCNNIGSSGYATCSVNEAAKNDSCGSSANVPSVATPSTNLCSNGTVNTPVSGDGINWSWLCDLAGGGDYSYCTAPVPSPIGGTCGAANGVPVFTAPVSGFCGSGNYSGFSSLSPWKWTCLGINGGSTASCTAPLAVGNCGSANGQYFTSAPTTNLCSSGTASASGQWNWTCNGTACSANQEYACARCSTGNSYAWATFMAPDAGCSGPIGGTSASYSQNCGCGAKAADPFGYAASCVAPAASVSASPSTITAGDSSLITYSSSNATSCWASGAWSGWISSTGGTQYVSPASTSSYTIECWNAGGMSSGKQSTTITVNPRINGSCGAANGIATLAAPTSGFCNTGNYSGILGTGPWTWSCSSPNGGSTASCTAPLAVGNCGSANGQYFTSAPTTNLCSSGTASASGQWNWTCNGTACSANQEYACARCSTGNSYAWATFMAPDAGCSGPIGGTSASYSQNCGCGAKAADPFGYAASCVAPAASVSASPSTITAGDSSLITYSSSNATSCWASGAWSGWISSTGGTQYVSPASTSSYTIECWNSAGVSTGQKTTTISVAAVPVVNGACGSDNNQNFTGSAVPTILCSAGTPSALSGTWTWTCAGSGTGSTASCIAYKLFPINGSCGSDNNKTLKVAPTNLCDSGSASSVSGAGPWTWSCNGIDGGSSSTCSANLWQTLKTGNMKEVSP